MTDYVANILRSPIAAPAGASVKLRDPVLAGLADKCRFLFDLDFSWCYPGGDFSTRPAPGNPANNAVIRDINGRADGRHIFNTVFEAPRTTYAGGGFDFTAVMHRPFGVQGPADAWAPIHAGADDYFMWFGYYRLPASADWKASGGFATMFASTEATGFHISNADLLNVHQISPSAGNRRIEFSRQTAIGSVTSILLAPNDSHYGKVCQMGYWRTSAGVGCIVVPLDNEAAALSATAAAGANNSADYSATRPCWGDSGGSNTSMSAEDQAASNFRVYRGGLFDWAGVSALPQDILLADRTRVRARIAASAAGNGGTSLIFV